LSFEQEEQYGMYDMVGAVLVSVGGWRGLGSEAIGILIHFCCLYSICCCLFAVL
jgi:hypothetical protein